MTRHGSRPNQPLYVQGCSHPLPVVIRPDLMREWEWHWLEASAWAEHNWPPSKKLARCHRLLFEIANPEEWAKRVNAS